MDSIMIFGTRDLAMSSSLGMQTGSAAIYGIPVPFGSPVLAGSAAPFGEWIAVEQRKPAQSAVETASRVRLRTAVCTDVRTTHPLLTSAAEP